MFMRQYTETEKIFRLNEYISHLTELESPDLVIMGICGGVMPINEAIHNNFGILAHEVCASLKPDAVIVSTLFEDYPLEYFTELSNLFKYRFSLEPDCINLSNTMLDWGYLNELKRTKYLIKNQEAITKQLEKYKEMQTPVYNILDSRDSLRIGKFLEDKLISYSEVINA
jgi:peptide maturation system protein (TIGR04066 family)